MWRQLHVARPTQDRSQRQHRHVMVLLAHMLLDTLLERDNLASHLACNPSLQAGHIGQEGGSLVPIVAHAVQPETSVGQHALCFQLEKRQIEAVSALDARSEAKEWIYLYAQGIAPGHPRGHQRGPCPTERVQNGFALRYVNLVNRLVHTWRGI